MISILIPTYNYQINALVHEVHKQSKDLNIEFEIICIDDCSNINQENRSFQNLKYVQFIRNNRNIGRTETRQKLANLAKFEWILFLDADVIPLSNKFIYNYVKAIKVNSFDVCFGGFYYSEKLPSKELSLRWKYGRKKEMIPAELRQKKPFKIIISANLLIRKDLFLKINNLLKGDFYGYDPIFSLYLKENHAEILHIENPVEHLGLEDNKTYLKKKEKAAEVVFEILIKKQLFDFEKHDLVEMYLKLKSLKLITIVAFFFKIFKPILQKKLIGKSPSILLLNLYRLGYLTSLS